MNWLMIIILILFLICVIHGWRKGFLRLLFSLVSWIVMIVLVSYLNPYISSFLKDNTGIYEWIENRCTATIQSRLGTGLEFLTTAGGEMAADWILKGVVFLVTLILVIILLRLIYRALGIVNHIPILRGINKVLGLFAGGVEAYILVSLFFMFVSVIAGTEPGGSLTACINESGFLSALYYHNAMVNLL
ncbi:MAG: CvpA family protein [Clostridiales bacterium]|nr:CvpA family protein [Clostridiales bacterium]